MLNQQATFHSNFSSIACDNDNEGKEGEEGGGEERKVKVIGFNCTTLEDDNGYLSTKQNQYLLFHQLSHNTATHRSFIIDLVVVFGWSNHKKVSFLRDEKEVTHIIIYF